jgi:hypothetical protein
MESAAGLPFHPWQSRTMQRHLIVSLSFTIALFAAGGLWAADLIDEVPNDALGFVYAHNLAAVDAKIGQLSATIQHNLPRPLELARQVTGLREGIKADGDFLVVLFPESGDNGGPIRFCVWVPVLDYDRFLASIHAKPVEGIAVVTIAGEDLLVARRGEWALLMDPDQKDRLAELVAAAPSPSVMPSWKPWINSNDVTVAAFAPGARAIMNWIDEDSEANDGGGGSARAGDIFGPGGGNGQSAGRGNRREASGIEAAKVEFRKWSAAAPELQQALQQMTVTAVGLRLDSTGNALGGVRIALGKEFTDEMIGTAGKKDVPLPPSVYDGGGFAVQGAGHVPMPMLAAMADAYVRRTAADLVAEEKTELDPESLKQLQEALDKATADIQSVAVLSQPGEEAPPVYTNNYFVLRVESAAKFVEQAKEVMRLWNKANRDAKGGTHMLFDSEETKVGEISATQYSMDVAALDGGAVVPEVRQAMERLFGPGGKLRIWIVPADETTVLLAGATSDQVTAAMKVLDKKQSMNWQQGELAAVNSLLPVESDWRAFVDPHRYNDWMRRESLAMIGVPVIGGPLVRDFPISPAVGIAGGIKDGEVWIDAAVPAQTIRGADVFFARNRMRGSVQIRGRIGGPGQPPAIRPN